MKRNQNQEKSPMGPNFFLKICTSLKETRPEEMKKRTVVVVQGDLGAQIRQQAHGHGLEGQQGSLREGQARVPTAIQHAQIDLSCYEVAIVEGI